MTTIIVVGVAAVSRGVLGVLPSDRPSEMLLNIRV